jgi:phenylpyruvate tautomerase PptA (4-oxalocrotonate tautomerase family)
MPLVRIDLNKSYNSDDCKKIGELVYRAMEEAISVPKDDKFQIITRHNTSDINIPDSYLGIKYTDKIVIIQITLNGGRSTELKQKLYKRIAEDLNKDLNIRKEDVFISLVEVAKENWSFGNGEAQYASK